MWFSLERLSMGYMGVPMSDGGLRAEFRKRFPTWQWTSIETGATASGVPDSEFCTPTGVEGWVEFKFTDKFYVQIKSFQVSWLMKRRRYGGNAWIAVRRTPTAKKWAGVDELWFMDGNQADALFYNGLYGVTALCWEGGPSNWNFGEVGTLLSKPHGVIISSETV
jgi:hypothetical protein